MKALVIKKSPSDNEFFELREVPKPTPQPKDLLVKLKAASINPVDTKVRRGIHTPLNREYIILGFDGAGVVEAVGSDAKLFKVGDEVYFAGSVIRDGTNAEYIVVDERIVGRKPKNLTWEQAAAIPLCGLTAWEGLVEQLHLDPNTDYSAKSILVVAGAGGVGSIVVPLVKKIFKFQTIATASRAETVDYVKNLGADHVIDHRRDLVSQLKELGYNQGVDYIYNCADASQNTEQLLNAIAPFGAIVNITAVKKAIEVDALFRKRATLTYEYMFARPITGVEIEKQHQILNHLADLTEQGIIPDRATAVLSLKKDLTAAHKQLESGTTIGKVVLTVDL